MPGINYMEPGLSWGKLLGYIPVIGRVKLSCASNHEYYLLYIISAEQVFTPEVGFIVTKSLASSFTDLKEL